MTLLDASAGSSTSNATSPAAPSPTAARSSSSPSRDPKLTARQRRFVVAYAASGNATQAARESGYGGNDATLSVTGSRLLGNAKVIAALEDLDARSEATKIADRVQRLEWLTQVVRGEVTEEVATAKGIVRVSVRAKDRIRAAELIARMNGELVERRQHGIEPGEAGASLADALAGIAAKRLGKAAG